MKNSRRKYTTPLRYGHSLSCKTTNSLAFLVRKRHSFLKLKGIRFRHFLLLTFPISNSKKHSWDLRYPKFRKPVNHCYCCSRARNRLSPSASDGRPFSSSKYYFATIRWLSYNYGPNCIATTIRSRSF